MLTSDHILCADKRLGKRSQSGRITEEACGVRNAKDSLQSESGFAQGPSKDAF